VKRDGRRGVLVVQEGAKKQLVNTEEKEGEKKIESRHRSAMLGPRKKKSIRKGKV
jgi:hypothetical protein